MGVNALNPLSITKVPWEGRVCGDAAYFLCLLPSQRNAVTSITHKHSPTMPVNFP